jgi:hypothetical protein
MPWEKDDDGVQRLEHGTILEKAHLFTPWSMFTRRLEVISRDLVDTSAEGPVSWVLLRIASDR